jgi:hypothetical protein
MAYVKLTKAVSDRAGVTLPASSAVTQQSFDNSGQELIVIKNGGAGPITVTIDIPFVVDGQAVEDRTVTIAAGATKVIGPFNRATYNQTDGTVHLDLSDTASVTIGVVQMGVA